jgi:hypothetical protein
LATARCKRVDQLFAFIQPELIDQQKFLGDRSVAVSNGQKKFLKNALGDGEVEARRGSMVER